MCLVRKLHFSDSLADTDGLWQIECSQTLLGGASEKDPFPGKADLAGGQF